MKQHYNGHGYRDNPNFVKAFKKKWGLKKKK